MPSAGSSELGVSANGKKISKSTRPSGRRGRLTMEEKGRLWEALNEPGVKVRNIARDFGVSQVTVWTWNKKFKAGATKEEFTKPVNKSRRLTQDEKGLMYESLGDPSLSVTDVAKKFDVSYTTAWRWNERFNGTQSKLDFMQAGDSTKRLSVDEKSKLWEALNESPVNLTKIARTFNVSLGTVWKYNEKLKAGTSKEDFLDPPAGDAYGRLTIDKKNELWEELSKPGVNVAEVAQRFGIHP